MPTGHHFSAAEDALAEPLTFSDPIMIDTVAFDLPSYSHDFDLAWMYENGGGDISLPAAVP